MMIRNPHSEYIKMDIIVMDVKEKGITGGSTRIIMDGMMRKLEIILVILQDKLPFNDNIQ